MRYARTSSRATELKNRKADTTMVIEFVSLLHSSAKDECLTLAQSIGDRVEREAGEKSCISRVESAKRQYLEASKVGVIDAYFAAGTYYMVCNEELQSMARSSPCTYYTVDIGEL